MPNAASARAWSCASAFVGYTYSARARGSLRSTSSASRLKHIDFPDAVPLVMIVGASSALRIACSWCE